MLSGSKIPCNYSEAAHWLKLAAEHGSEVAQYCLGLMYEEGEGVENDIELAVEWYRKAANKGNEDAKVALERLTSNSTLVTSK